MEEMQHTIFGITAGTSCDVTVVWSDLLARVFPRQVDLLAFSNVGSAVSRDGSFRAFVIERRDILDGQGRAERRFNGSRG